jgi:hypothetical protein
MTDKPATPEPLATERIPSVEGGISGIGSAHAPIIFFDGAPTMGHYNGVAHITLAAMRFLPGPDRVIADNVIVAHLRMNMPALMALKDAIAKIELLAEPVPEGKKN